MSRYDELRKNHPLFIYHSYELCEDCLRFHFQIDEYHFHPEWTFDKRLTSGEYSRPAAEYAAFSLGMAELVSYWKCTCSPNVEIRCGWLNQAQIRWWKKLYFNGLGEFFYRNEIPARFDDFMTITAPEQTMPFENTRPLSGALVPVGGGKDSVVTLEILKAAKTDITPYVINALPAAMECVSASGIAEIAVAPRRAIDKTLLDLNKAGYLNGHTPFSAVVAFSSLLFGILLNKRYIVLSNESSANETYVSGAEVNHQYSKSTEFERDFREYCADYFRGCPEYFSLLRPLSEWQIARSFVKFPRYYGVFRSCNLGSRKNIWCRNCAKCLYVYILLAAFLDDRTLTEIFGENLLERADLAPMLDGLMLDGEDKPFECVGTKSEVRLSLKMASDRRKSALPTLLERFENAFPDYSPIDLTRYFDRDNFVPEQFLPYLEKIAYEN